MLVALDFPKHSRLSSFEMDASEKPRDAKLYFTTYFSRNAAASAAEKEKRKKKGGPRRDTMEKRVRRVGKEFFPVGFEMSGASTSHAVH